VVSALGVDFLANGSWIVLVASFFAAGFFAKGLRAA
jgi:hypothetical protein